MVKSRNCSRPHARIALIVAAALISGVACVIAAAQDPQTDLRQGAGPQWQLQRREISVLPTEHKARPLGGFQSIIDVLPENKPRTTEQIRSFIDTLSVSDALIEVKIGQSRLITLKQDLLREPGRPDPTIAVSDPTTIDFDILGPRHIRIIGQRFGLTDISILLANREYFSFEVQVVAELDILRARLRQLFPASSIGIAQLRDHLIVEGQAPNTAEMNKIYEMIEAYMTSVHMSFQATGGGTGRDEPPAGRAPPVRGAPRETPRPGDGRPTNGRQPEQPPPDDAQASPESARPSVAAQPPPFQIIKLIQVPLVDDIDLLTLRTRERFPDADVRVKQIGVHVVVEGQARNTGQVQQIIGMIKSFVNDPQGQGSVVNLLKVPGPQQVMLKVQIAELSRTALREMGVSFFFRDGRSTFGSNAGRQLPSESGGAGGANLGDVINATTTVFGTFDNSDIFYFVNALRSNNVLHILAEPNLVAYHGESADFLAGGEFPVPVPQGGASSGAITIEYKEFGVALAFVPHIIDDDTIRLTVDPEVSTIQQTIAIGTIEAPLVETRRAHTVVELSQGQTLAIAGLLSANLEANTNRVPIMGDLPYIGAFFSNKRHRRDEKELLVFVTPYLVDAIEADQCATLPGTDVEDPTDMEFYLLGRTEGRTGKKFRATTHWDDPMGLVRILKLQNRYVHGPNGYSE